eukprot:49141-Eustigmatos_ZCMA.PRE.1
MTEPDDEQIWQYAILRAKKKVAARASNGGGVGSERVAKRKRDSGAEGEDQGEEEGLDDEEEERCLLTGNDDGVSDFGSVADEEVPEGALQNLARRNQQQRRAVADD